MIHKSPQQSAAMGIFRVTVKCAADRKMCRVTTVMLSKKKYSEKMEKMRKNMKKIRKNMKKITKKCVIFMLLVVMVLPACSRAQEGLTSKEEPSEAPTEQKTSGLLKETTPEPTKEATPEPTKEPTPEPTEEATPEPTEEATPEPTEEPTPDPTEEATPEPTEEATPEPTKEPDGEEEHTTETGTNIVHKVSDDAPWIVIDAGHQSKGDSETEPIAPGSSERKAKVSSGTTGRYTGLPEYKLNLAVSLMLRDALLEKGYNVIMIRETNDVKISNAERAEIANNANADVFIRVHANASEDKSVKGALTICQTSKNKYVGETYEVNKRLSKCVLKHIVEETGAKDRGVWETDTMSGINWCKVPVTIVEMGFMTNKEEDELLSTTEYREKMVKGMVDGIEEFLAGE